MGQWLRAGPGSDDGVATVRGHEVGSRAWAAPEAPGAPLFFPIEVEWGAAENSRQPGLQWAGGRGMRRVLRL